MNPPVPFDAVAHIDGAEQRRRPGDRAVRDPRRLLPVDDKEVAILARDAIRLAVFRRADLVGEGDEVAAMARLGSTPAADQLGGAEALDELGPAGELRQHARKGRNAEADGQPGIAPAQFLGDDVPQPRALYRREVVVRIGVGVEAERAVLLEHVPQNRLRRDHVRGIGQPIERDAGRPHDLGGKLVHQVAYPTFLIRQVDIEIHHRHWSLLSIREALRRAAPCAAIARCEGA